MILYLWEDLASFNKNNHVNFSGEKKLNEALIKEGLNFVLVLKGL